MATFMVVAVTVGTIIVAGFEAPERAAAEQHGGCVLRQGPTGSPARLNSPAFDINFDDSGNMMAMLVNTTWEAEGCPGTLLDGVTVTVEQAFSFLDGRVTSLPDGEVASGSSGPCAGTCALAGRVHYEISSGDRLVVEAEGSVRSEAVICTLTACYADLEFSATGAGARLTGRAQFWFFDPGNVELVIKNSVLAYEPIWFFREGRSRP